MDSDERTVEAFGTLLAALCAAFRVEPSEALTEGYWMALEDLPIEAVAKAIRSAIRTCERMPTGSELRRLTGEMTTDARAVHAWGAVMRAIGQHGAYASVDFDDPVINATIRNLGGWQKLCATESGETKWVRKDFERIYGSLCTTGISRDAARHLAGIHEQGNSAAGHAVAPPKMVTTGLPPHREGVLRLDSDAPRGAMASRSEASSIVGQLVGMKAMPSGRAELDQLASLRGRP